ncbi:uncharacterized protein BP01DRAFT_165388 [Aspergillus saccharolyticus JOP 1030-1]|uniref:Uncharacterized protein n=1 Tax=Aspergillus saccharolyticus JOP 1030-1 TaxID=1450539 RepID=A0A318Z2W9_9EURO|nr:hypothetical protein BP01DRAFT_165388 [Aspergillus saccharolyticus JOP 1030-1]PYH41615.1 hypothetical protein BP01DRAFT_165388 [Aspergillus saccharolyticus JOP 1030-1]
MNILFFWFHKEKRKSTKRLVLGLTGIIWGTFQSSDDIGGISPLFSPNVSMDGELAVLVPSSGVPMGERGGCVMARGFLLRSEREITLLGWG